MAEVIKRRLHRKKHWLKVMNDFKKQGGLADMVINPLSITPHGCSGQTKKGTKFCITLAPNMFLLVSMSQEEQPLVEAFAKMVEYRPFCRYSNKYGLLTVEWDRKDPEGRFAELQRKGKKELQRIQ